MILKGPWVTPPAAGPEAMIWKPPPVEGREREGEAGTTWGKARDPEEETGTSWGRERGTKWAGAERVPMTVSAEWGAGTTCVEDESGVTWAPVNPWL